MTANLLKYDMRMPPERIHPLPMDEAVTIDGVTVTLMSANHCPGAVMMLFQVPQPGSGKVQVGSHACWTIAQLLPRSSRAQVGLTQPWHSHNAVLVAAPGGGSVRVVFTHCTGMLLKLGFKAYGADLARHCIWRTY